MFIRCFLLSLALILITACSDDKPNLIIIFTDDQGYGDLRVNGGEQVLTPNIDQMASEGARLTSFYVAAPLCTPSRAALMTGSYPQRISMDVPSSLTIDLPNLAEGTKFPVLLAGDGHGLHPNEWTIAEAAKSAGYTTAIIGKWHLGDQPEFFPTRQGFDSFYGLPYSHDIHPDHPRQEFFNFPPLPFLNNEEVIETDPDNRYLTRRFTEKAVEFIKKNKDEPFFLYIPQPLPHGPHVVSPEAELAYAEALKTDDTATDAVYENAIYEIDWSVGQILGALKEQGIDDNTIVMFTSDNGPGRGSSGPFSGGKGRTLEGGMRMPAVIRWPEKIKPGIEIDELLTSMDILPTFAELTGAQLAEDRIIDGKNILAVLTDNAASPHEYFFYSWRGITQAVRWKNWKFRTLDGEETLTDLSTDLAEENDLSSQYPEIVEQLKAAIADYNTEMKSNQRPVGVVNNPRPLSMYEE